MMRNQKKLLYLGLKVLLLKRNKTQQKGKKDAADNTIFHLLIYKSEKRI